MRAGAHERRTRAAAAILVTAALLGACATTPEPAGPGPSLSGRLSVSAATEPPRRFTAGFELRGNQQAGQLALMTPLGTILAQALWSDGRVRLVSAAGERAYDSLDALAMDLLGETLPLNALLDWLRGQPWPKAASAPRGDGLAGFRQLGWQIDLSRWDQGGLLARREAAPELTVHVRLER